MDCGQKVSSTTGKMKNLCITTKNPDYFTMSNIPEHLTAYQLYSALKQYGPIEKMICCVEKEIIVKFMQSQKELRSTKKIQLLSSKISLKWLRDKSEWANLDDYYEFSHEDFPSSMDFLVPPSMKPQNKSSIHDCLLQPHSHKSPKHILNALNDDCLVAIFEQNLLAIKDMREIAVVCKRFNWITTNLMKKPRHRYADRFLNLNRSEPLWCVENFLREYGVSVTYANLTEFKSSAVVLGMLAEYCPNMQYLGCSLRKQADLDEIRPIFGKLRRLLLFVSSTVDFNTALTNNTNSALEVWKLSTWSEVILPPVHLPKMTSFEWLCNTKMNKTSLKAFVVCNPQLETLLLNDPEGELVPELEYFLENLPNLQTLQFTYSGYHSDQDVYLSLIRKDDDAHFYVEGEHLSSADVQSALTVLERMQINLTSYGTFFYFDNSRMEFMEYARAICKHKTITSLNVQDFNDDQMFLLAQHLSQLNAIDNLSNKLTFKGMRRFLETATAIKKATFTGFVFTDDDEDDIKAIDDMVRGRGIKLRVSGLQCDSDNAERDYARKDELEEKYSAWVY